MPLLMLRHLPCHLECLVDPSEACSSGISVNGENPTESRVFEMGAQGAQGCTWFCLSWHQSRKCSTYGDSTKPWVHWPRQELWLPQVFARISALALPQVAKAPMMCPFASEWYKHHYHPMVTRGVLSFSCKGPIWTNPSIRPEDVTLRCSDNLISSTKRPPRSLKVLMCRVFFFSWLSTLLLKPNALL